MTLESLAGKRNLLIGVAVQTIHLKNNFNYRELIKREFNLITPENEMKWQRLSKGKGIYDFSDADYITDFAQENSLKVHGHVLVWDRQLPEWLVKSNFPPAELKEILQQHIRTVLHHFKGKVIAWDVVNEALVDEDEGELDKNNFWYKNLGPEYIELAFRCAHEVDPQVELFYNEWGAEGLGKKSEEMYKLISGLINKKVPITGIGLQMHIGLGFSPSPKDVVKNIKKYTNLGLKVYITEMDVRIQYGKGSLEKKLEEQSKIYRDLIETIIDGSKIEALIFWGLDDQHSWITWSENKNDAPLLFDRNLKPKPAYYAVTEALK